MERRKSNMKKKTLTIVLLIVIAALALFGYKTFLSPKGVDGSKDVAIQIVVETEDINESFDFKTDHEFLIELLNENQEELGLTLEEYDFGSMIIGMMNYITDESKNEYFHIYINELDATLGPAEIPLNNNDNYKFELKKW